MTDIATDRITAPFTRDQIKALNRYQREGLMHPFTCVRDHDEHVLLVAGPNGWWCPVQTCTYTQEWAHGFMADETWMDSHPLPAFVAAFMQTPKPAATTTRREALQEAIQVIIADMRPEAGWSERNANMLAAAERVRELDLSIPYPFKPAAFTCPRCTMTSHNPNDIREGYCGNCKEWTGGGAHVNGR